MAYVVQMHEYTVCMFTCIYGSYSYVLIARLCKYNGLPGHNTKNAVAVLTMQWQC